MLGVVRLVRDDVFLVLEVVVVGRLEVFGGIMICSCLKF
jgi:hypothetical protein